MGFAHFLTIFILLQLLNVSLCDSEIQNTQNTTQNQFTPTNLANVVHTLNKNGHTNLIFVSLDYNDMELNHTLSALSFHSTISSQTREINQNNSILPKERPFEDTHTWPRKTKIPPRRCFTEECYYIHWFKNRPSTPIIYMFDDNIKMDKDNTMVFLDSSLNSSHWEFYLKEIAERKVSSSVIVTTKTLTIEQKQSFVDYLDQLGKNTMFYWLHLMEGQDKNDERLWWHQVITLNGNNKAVINQVNFDGNTRIKETYDMQGAHIVSISLSWTPYYLLYDCDDQGKECKSNGYLKNLMDSLGTLMNFTWECHQEINNNWGLVPDTTGKWDGVMGHVLNGTYQLSIR